MNIPLRNDKIQFEKKKLLEKAPEPSLIEITTQRKPRIVFKRCFLCSSHNHLARKCPHRQTFENEKFVDKKKRKSKEKITGRFDKRASESTNISSNEKSSESHNGLETNELRGVCLKY